MDKLSKYCTKCLYYVNHARWSNSALGTLHECRHPECECPFAADHVQVLGQPPYRYRMAL